MTDPGIFHKSLDLLISSILNNNNNNNNNNNTNILDGRTVENKGKLILTEIFPLVQKHDI